MPRLTGFTMFMALVLVAIAFGMYAAYELNRPLEVYLPTFETIKVEPAPLLDLKELGIT